MPVDQSPTGPVGPRLPTSAALAARPFAYLLMAVVWAVIWLAAALLGPGSIAWLYFDQTITFGLVLGRMSPLEWVAFAVLIVPALTVCAGPAAMFYVPTMCWPNAALSAVYVVRSLRPSFAGERLSYTTWAAPGTTLGPPSVGPAAMSLQPVRRTRLTDVLMVWYAAGWAPARDTFVASLPAGLGWVAATLWTMHDLSDGVRTGALVVGVALVVVSVVLVARVMRRRVRRGVFPTDPRQSVGPSPDRRRRAPLPMAGGRGWSRRSPAARRRSGSDDGRTRPVRRRD